MKETDMKKYISGIFVAAIAMHPEWGQPVTGTSLKS
jgi:hypothetical protein